MIDTFLDHEITLLGYGLSARRVIKNPFFTGSAVMIIGSNIANFFGYLYHLILGRLLGPAQYGELASLISFYGIVVAIFSFLGMVIVKFVSAADEKQLPAILSWFNKKSLLVALLISVVIGAFSPAIARFLHIDITPVLILIPTLFVTVVTLVYRSFLQGLLRFKEYVISTNIDVGSRVIVATLLVLAGFGVAGGILGFLISAVISLGILIYFLRGYKLAGQESKFGKGSKVFSFSVPIIILSLTSTALYTVDVMLVKHFFPPETAGIYAAVSTVSKIIFFGTTPVTAVMFPMVSKKFSNKEDFIKVLLISMGTVTLIASGVIAVFALLPELMVDLLFGSDYLAASRYIPFFGIFMGIFALCFLLLNFFMAIERTKAVYFSVAAALIQAAGITFLHESLTQVISVSMVSALFLLTALLIYGGLVVMGEKRYNR